MHQLLQNLKNGETLLETIPQPSPGANQALIETNRSLISLGTERMLVEFGQSSFIQKAKKQPEKVKQVLDKIKTDGLVTTLNAVKTKLDTPIPLGYSNVGKVSQVGSKVGTLKVGDRVVSNGPHADFVTISETLCAVIPDNVTDDEASFTVTGAIGLQGIRLLDPKLGEQVVVIGLGLIGLLSCQMLRANGCSVIGVDTDAAKCKLAEAWGVHTICLADTDTHGAILAIQTLTNGIGADGVLITASTSSNEPLHLAAQCCRTRGKVVLVGVIGNEWSRADFYDKEISFQVSCSYGPGRYDSNYEDKGQDYPIGYVRWTEKRNFDAFLGLLADKKIDVSPLITQHIPFSEAPGFYKDLSSQKQAIGVIIDYDTAKDTTKTVVYTQRPSPTSTDTIGIGFIGAGNFTKSVLLPNLTKIAKTLPLQFNSIVSRNGVSANHLAKKHKFQQSSTDLGSIFNDPNTNTVFVTTGHNTHGQFVKQALDAGKHVFVEKPLCLSKEELDQIAEAHAQSSSLIMVGYNRRFSPHVQKMKSLISSHAGPKSLIMTVNAGHIPKDHWTQDPEIGGGRLIGEGIHFIDLAQFIVGRSITSHTVSTMDDADSLEDTFSLSLAFEDGSIGTIHYFANGSKAFPKERITLFSQGTILECNNFKETKGYGFSGFKTFKTPKQDKGHFNQLTAFLSAISTGSESPVPFDDIYTSTSVALDAISQYHC